MSDRLVFSAGDVIRGDKAPADGRHWTEVRCSACSATGWTLTHSLPLAPGLNALRDVDGVRVGLCQACARPNRAQRRGRR